MFNKQFLFFAVLILIGSTFLYTVRFDNFLFIQSGTYIQLVFSILAIPAGLWLVFYKNNKSRFVKIDITDLILFFFAGYILITYLFSKAYNRLLNPITSFIVWIGIYIIVKQAIKTDKESKAKILFYLFSFTACFQIVYAILQYLDILPCLFYHRYGGSFGNSGDLASFLTVTYSVTFGLLFLEKSRRRRILLITIILLHLFLIVISVARTAWIAVLVSTLFLVLNTRFFKKVWAKTLVKLRSKKWIIPVIIIGIFLFVGLAAWKMYGIKSSSANGRLFIWKTCIQAIKEKPLFGHGYESFLTVQRNAQIDYFASHPEDMKNGMLAANSAFAFNDFLQFTVEYGIFGLILLLGIFALLFRKVKPPGYSGHEIVLTVQAAVVSIFVCALFSYPLQNQTIMLLFVTLLAIRSSYDDTILQFTLKPALKIPILIVFIGLNLFLLNFNIRKIENGLKWKKAHALSQKNPEKAYEIYSEIHGFMDHDRSFISNYGSVFYNLKEYDKLVEYYEKCGYLCTSSDILQMVGDSYDKLENYPKAEEYYRKASDMIPHLFVPRYKLFKLYLKTGEVEKANEEAIKIKDMKIKVYSDKVKFIKTEVNEYLYNLTITDE